MNELVELEEVLAELADGHDALADGLLRQRAAIRRADTAALPRANEDLDRQARRIGQAERRRRELCGRLGERLADSPAAPGGGAGCTRLGELAARLGAAGRGAGDRTASVRLRASADRLRRQVQRVSALARVNQAAAAGLTEFCGQFLGRLSRAGRETGCYDRQGRRALAREPLVRACFVAIG